MTHAITRRTTLLHVAHEQIALEPIKRIQSVAKIKVCSSVVDTPVLIIVDMCMTSGVDSLNKIISILQANITVKIIHNDSPKYLFYTLVASVVFLCCPFFTLFHSILSEPIIVRDAIAVAR